MTSMMMSYPRWLLLGLFVVALATPGCHFQRGPTVRGVAPGPLGFGGTAERAVIFGVREFEPRTGAHGEVWQIDQRHDAIVLDLSRPGEIVFAARVAEGLPLGHVWPIHGDVPQPAGFLLYPDRAVVVPYGSTAGGVLDRQMPVIRLGDGYAASSRGAVSGDLFPAELGTVSSSDPPRSVPEALLALSPDEHFLAGLYVEHESVGAFLIELVPEPRLVRATTWIARTGPTQLHASTAVRDDGTQLVHARSETDASLVSFAPDGTRTDLPSPRDEILQLLPLETGWLAQTPSAIVRVDDAGRVVDRSSSGPRSADATRWLLQLGAQLVWFELATVDIDGGDRADLERSIQLCATWLSADLDASASTCTTLTAAALTIGLPPFHLDPLRGAGGDDTAT